jgi:hypothetical protein
MTEPTRNPDASTESLQFDRVDAASMKCATCAKPIVASYYDVDGKSVCIACKEAAERLNQPARGAGTFFKSLFFGGIGAFVGAAIYYGVAALTGWEIAIVALVIGLLVGGGVRFGTGGRGGRLFQVMAVVLAYFAVGLAYTPFAIKEVIDATDSTASADSTGGIDSNAAIASVINGLSPTVPPPAAPPSADSSIVALAGDTGAAIALDSATQLTAGTATLAIGVVLIGGFLMAFVLPIMAIVGSMPSGLINAVIIGVGMHQAWKMTAAQVHTISGPYRVGGDGASPAAPPAA